MRTILTLLTMLLSTTARADEPFACQLHALSATERARHETLTQRLLKSVAERKELPNGWAFRIPKQPLPEIAEWIDLESRCCPFFDFDLQVSKSTNWLSLTGKKGVKAFIQSEFAL